ncbi:hypothetical protein PV08_03018 [Exophiala spinifera]|uniref:PLD phosphodiesterase domain-containing protein n=1 Tax=Exophiala spinifera TaxID=91928 RepID=A0A0D2C555_9EURO|nr:uncharacterized protein PV08_03018 [Exophiala spinifera]KIW18729.1 hypothetical protein PV08_03018 [Exophiala spinifera]
MDYRPSKRVKRDSGTTSSEIVAGETVDAAGVRARRARFLSSISRPISPPGTSRSGTGTPQPETSTASISDQGSAQPPASQKREHRTRTLREGEPTATRKPNGQDRHVRYIPSPFRLTSIRDLPASGNNDTVSLHGILGNPLIKEAWIFNYCFDVDWLMTFFDPDIRPQVKVKVVHGSWKRDSENRIAIDEACKRWPNVEALTAYLPDQFGTHHSKMFVLFTHDDLAQVIIHTANMLHKDWTNMTQAVWQTPPLPKLAKKPSDTVGNIGSGSRFKYDLVQYLTAYGNKTRSLREQLVTYDFSSVRGALISSVPSRMKDFSIESTVKELWSQKLYGYPSLFRALKTITTHDYDEEKVALKNDAPSHPHVVCQVSSIATLPVTWLNQFFPPLSGYKSGQKMWDHISIIFPTPSNVAASLDGYASGGSIHTKAQSAAHLKQIATLKRSLCQWTQGPQLGARAGRDQAAPHIKTYVRFKEKPSVHNATPGVEWALLTSANLSTQAWGTLREKEKVKEIVVQSYEIGVLVWPELFDGGFDTGENERHGTRHSENDDDDGQAQTQTHARDDKSTARMVPVFGSDDPKEFIVKAGPAPSDGNDDGDGDGRTTLVGLRLPYDLPLTSYEHGDMPWSPQGTYDVPDRQGRRWPRDFY